MNACRRRGFTLVELLVVIAIIGVLVALLLPAVQAAREAARRIQCSNHLKQLGLALHNYHDTNNAFPYLIGGPESSCGTACPPARLSGLVALLPFMEQQPLYDRIGHAPSFVWDTGFTPWAAHVSAFLCPSDIDTSDVTPLGQNNYVFSIGDTVNNIYWDSSTRIWPNKIPTRGLFGGNSFTRMADITDGTSNTVAMAEIPRPPSGNAFGRNTSSHTTNPVNCRASFVNGQYTTALVDRNRTLGTRWADGRAGYNAFNTVLPPNSPSCNGQTNSGILSAGSRHPGGVNVLMADASVQFIAETIDAGNPSAGTPASGRSNYGVWGAMGTKDGDEVLTSL